MLNDRIKIYFRLKKKKVYNLCWLDWFFYSLFKWLIFDYSRIIDYEVKGINGESSSWIVEKDGF